MVVNHIFNLEGTIRHQLYFSVLLYLAGFQQLAFPYAIFMGLFYWDEFKVEFLDYDEYLEDCLEAFDFDVSSHLQRARQWETTVHGHYSQPGQSFPSDLYLRADAEDPSSDFEEGRLADAFDHPEMYGVLYVAEFLQEEWLFLAEHTVGPRVQHTYTDLEDFYHFYSKDRPVDVAQNNNKHFFNQENYAWHPVICKSAYSQKLTLKPQLQRKADMSYYLWSLPDDFALLSSARRKSVKKKLKKAN